MLKFTLTFLCCCFLTFLVMGQSFESSLESKINEVLPHMLAHQRHIHQYPKPAYQVKETSAYIAREMQKHGYQVYRNDGGGTGVMTLRYADCKPDIAHPWLLGHFLLLMKTLWNWRPTLKTADWSP